MGAKMFKEIKLFKFIECYPCQFNKVLTRDNKKEPLNPYAPSSRSLWIARHNECITGIEYCDKFKTQLKRENVGTRGIRCQQCIKKYDLYNLPNDYKPNKG